MLTGYFPLSSSVCVIWATLDVLMCTASIWHMCIMSVDRFLTLRYCREFLHFICRPTKRDDLYLPCLKSKHQVVRGNLVMVISRTSPCMLSITLCPIHGLTFSPDLFLTNCFRFLVLYTVYSSSLAVLYLGHSK